MHEDVIAAIRSGKFILEFGDVKLEIQTIDSPTGGSNRGKNNFFMAKSVPYIEGYLDLIKDRHINSILELGIFKGGSVVFFDQVLKPRQLTAIDLETSRLVDLDEYIKDHSVSNVSLNYGVNQADKDALTKIIETDFPQGIDLVVDDASHFYAPSKSSFETIFPHVNPGGYYVVEDWSWSHSNPQDGGDNEDVTRLLHELIALHARRADIISHIRLQPGFFSLTRGWASLTEGFSLESTQVNKPSSIQKWMSRAMKFLR